MDRAFLGTWSDKNFDKLDKKIRDSFLAKKGPGELPGQRRSGHLRPLLVPTGAYADVGVSLAWAYKEIAEREFADVYLLLAGYPGKGVITNLFVDWRTPFGTVKVNKEIGQQLLRQAKISNVLEPFTTDVQIESQLPFLQFACRDRLDKIEIVPLLVGDVSPQEWVDIGEAIGDVAQNKKLGIICCAPADAGVVSYLTTLNAAEAVNSARRRNLEYPQVFGVFAETMIYLYSEGGVILSHLFDQYTMMF